MSYLLDTNAVIALLTNRPPAVREKLRTARAQPTMIAIPAIVLFELCYGVSRSQHRTQNAERLRIFLSGEIEIISFEPADAEIAGDLRFHLEALGTPIGPYDLLIAAQALRTGMILITANVKEFARVPDLKWADWSVGAS